MQQQQQQLSASRCLPTAKKGGVDKHDGLLCERKIERKWRKEKGDAKETRKECKEEKERKKKVTN